MTKWPARFLDLLAETEGPTLDCGSAGRRRPGVVSLDITANRGLDVQADALNLPFPDATFALVLSQAVLEHVTDPQRYIDEIVRVLQPGGTLWLEVAFLQPLHCVPHHYFGVTRYGAAHVCRALDIREMRPIDDLVMLWDWIGREVNAGPEWGKVRDVVASVPVSEAQMWAVAPGIGLLGVKP